MRIRAEVEELDLFLPFSLARAFFSHASTLEKRHGRINVGECFEDVVSITSATLGPNPPPDTLVNSYPGSRLCCLNQQLSRAALAPWKTCCG